jgi:hypothetical protein
VESTGYTLSDLTGGANRAVKATGLTVSRPTTKGAEP